MNLSSKQAILKRLANSTSDLETIEFSSDLSNITLVFSHQGVPESRIAVLLGGVVDINISRPLDFKDGLAFVIMEMTLNTCESRQEIEGHNVELYRVHLEGEICGDIICRFFDLLLPVC